MYLSEVELGVFLVRDTLDLKEGSVGARVALGPLVAENATLGVKSAASHTSHKPVFLSWLEDVARERAGIQGRVESWGVLQGSAVIQSL